MSPLGVTVTTGEAPAGSGVPTTTGTAFFAGLADQGPATPVPCRSINDFVTSFGPRSETSSVLYDAVDIYLREGGALVYAARATDDTAVAASLTLLDSSRNPTIEVAAKTDGIDGNDLRIAVVVATSRFTVTVLDADGDLLETHGPFSRTSELFAESSGRVTFSQSARTDFTTANPATLAASSLAGGTNPSDIDDAALVATLDTFGPELGAGQVAIPGRASSDVWEGLAQHAAAMNRWPCPDMADSASVAELIAALGDTGSELGGSGGVFVSSTVQAPGLVAGTTRTVPASAVVAALCARVAATGNDNQAPAGTDWPLLYVTGFTNEFTDDEITTLNAAGINSFSNRFGVLCLFGFSTPVLPAQDRIFWQGSAGRERMALVADVRAVAEPFLFRTLDGRGVTVTSFQGQLQQVIVNHWSSGALYGDTALDAGSVTTAPPVNTAETAELGELNAALTVKISPYAQAITINITSTPITQIV